MNKQRLEPRLRCHRAKYMTLSCGDRDSGPAHVRQFSTQLDRDENTDAETKAAGIPAKTEVSPSRYFVKVYLQLPTPSP